MTELAFPSEESVFELQKDMNEALQKFGKANPDVQANIVMPLIVQIFLTYPHSWLKSAGLEQQFEETILKELNLFLTSTINYSKLPEKGEPTYNADIEFLRNSVDLSSTII
jgi:hypothetical protein